MITAVTPSTTHYYRPYRARRVIPMSAETENAIKHEAPHFKVLILHSVMSNWTSGDTEVSEGALKRMRRSLLELGYEVELATVRQDIAAPLLSYDPREYVV